MPIKLKDSTISILRDVYLGNPLVLDSGRLVNSANSTSYEIQNGIPVMIHKDFITGDNLKYMKMYNWMYLGYDFSESFLGRIFYGRKIRNMRNGLMNTLEIKRGDRVLYVSIGTGTDVKILSETTDINSIELVGADISIGMLKKCRRRMKRWGFNAELINCCAEALPFANDSFDAVFHVGGINYFTDKSRAIREMVRVAKPGTKIMIADETQKLVDELYKKNPASKKYFEGIETMIESPVKLLPQNVNDIRFETLMDDRFYCLTFRKD
jgi:ubiquinone/menaquinone biosynthesis C-methylase UbiE